ncbi:uridine kinase [Striga asiatica]|uniref:Uridine kinase n=1 Tax=Striga asiatica TaxID=4170 RepID=A0A5A7Q5N0_STRAF|nr:uridine kinase [Striga asiatica]
MDSENMLCPPITCINWEIFQTRVSQLSCENQFKRKSSIPALTHDARLDRESLSRCRNILSPCCCSGSLLCPIIRRWWRNLVRQILHFIKRKKENRNTVHADTQRSEDNSRLRATNLLKDTEIKQDHIFILRNKQQD